MCGIAGILDYSGMNNLYSSIRSMTHKLLHRGPDGYAVFKKDPVAMGHTRLSVIDLEQGSQPMSTEDGRLTITFNGEIYNYKELRSDLSSWGYNFRTASDTEVILANYLRYGVDCTKHFVGMFAFCISDYYNRELFLARDHSGIKPLYYWEDKNFFAFSSELSALRALRCGKLTGSLQSVDYYLRYQYIPSPDTIYQEIKRLPPAHQLLVPFDSRSTELERYWRLSFTENKPTPSLEQIKYQVEMGIKRAMVADVPVGLFLSGGMDSTLIAKVARKYSNYPLKAFSVGFRQNQYSELEYAIQAAKTLDIEHYFGIIDQRALLVLPKLIEHYGEPFGDSSCVPTWHVSRLAREHVKTVLSGDGGDEVFAGYHRYFTWFKQRRNIKLRIREFRRAGKDGRIRNFRSFFDSIGCGPELWSKFIYITQYNDRRRLWKKSLKHLADVPSELFWDAYRHAKGRGRLAYAQAVDFETYLPGDILNKVDIATMCHGLEARPALLDKKLLEVAARLSTEMKYSTGVTGKISLQKLLMPEFNDHFIKRRKQGFVVPRNEWMSPGNIGFQMLQELIADKSLPMNQWFDEKEIENHIAMQGAGRNNSHHLWLLLVLAIWTDQNRGISFNI